MSDTERARVGQALDLLRDALSAYVDVAMADAYGEQWDERVSEEDAKRRPTGRKQPVSKSDLAVMLKVIQHERIAPWWSSTTYTDPRIRSFASEILTLRHLYAHGNDCVKEHARLLDTASRLLQLLGLSVPDGLESSGDAGTKDLGDESGITVSEEPRISVDIFDREVARLGESGRRLAEMFSRAAELTDEYVRGGLTSAEPDAGQVDADSVQRAIVLRVGAEVFDLLDETYRLEAGGEHDSTVEKVLTHLVRSTLLNPLLLLAALAHVTSFDADSPPSESELRAAQNRLILLNKWTAQGPLERARELVKLAQSLDEGSVIANSIIVLGNVDLLDDPSIESDDALELLRDSSTRVRMLAAMDPGSQYETWVALFLRREGKLCNDLGRADEATRAFARAAEIIDRYPAADPDLVF